LSFCANHFEVNRASVAVFMKHADVTDQVDIAASIGLIGRIAWAALTAFAVANVYVFYA